MKLITKYFFWAICCSGCVAGESDKSLTDSVAVDNNSGSQSNSQTAKLSGCYTWVSGRDSASMRLDVNGKMVSGALDYNLYEKDKNTGTFSGEIANNLIVADYTFSSEGMTTVREVVFRQEGNALIQGYGDIDVQGDTARFKNINDLEYNSESPFVKTECP